jgi:hypothetical protein
MGPETTAHMLLGAIVGWAILSPLVKIRGWAPGPVNDWITGSRGWIVWVSLAIMLADSIISLVGIVVEPLVQHFSRKKVQRRGSYQPLPSEEENDPGRLAGLRRRRLSGAVEEDEIPEKDAPPEDLVPTTVVVGGLILSGILCIVATKVVFGQVPLYATVVAFLLALVLSVMGVRALGMYSYVLASTDVLTGYRPN